MRGTNAFVLLVISISISIINGIPLFKFYPYGDENNNIRLASSINEIPPEVQLKTPIKFFDETYNSIYVNEFGCLTFISPLPEFVSAPFPLDYPTIAALYSNIDIRRTGTIYYKETQEPDVLQRANEDISKTFPKYVNQFNATSIFIATWIEVGYFNQTTEDVNTFQIVVITDSDETFVKFLYADNGIQWTQGVPNPRTGLSDAKAQAGLMQDGIIYSVPNSGTDQIKTLDKISNTNEPGVWIFRVGKLENLGKVESPELYIWENDKTCAAPATKCHSHSDCVDENGRHCCICKEGYFGNGINCLKKELPIRINGKISVDVNGVQANNLDVQSYVVTEQGRSYTSIAKVPPTIGSTLQIASFLANSNAWLFSRSVTSLNGYQITGGRFNYTADLIYSTGQRITIQEQFLGHDVFDKLKMEGTIKGTAPEVAYGAKIQLDDNKQEFTHASSGLIQSQSSHTYQLEAHNPPQITVRIVQNIQYTEELCQTQIQNITNARMKSARNMVVYEAKENILRIASTNTISSNNGDSDPCATFQCVVNSSCVVEDERPTCVCNRGFQQLYPEDRRDDSFGCYDINECSEGRAQCDPSAICLNEIGSYSCECRPGYTGNGYQCTVADPQVVSKSPCETDPLSCNPPHSTCTDPADYRSCNCNPGFQKDYVDDTRYAFVCRDVDECLHYPSICSNNEDCINLEGTYECRCKQGYEGDGSNCDNQDNRYSQVDNAAATCDRVQCPENAECIEDPTNGPHCTCKAGYSTNGARGVCELDSDMTENPNRSGDERGSNDPNKPDENSNSNGAAKCERVQCPENAECFEDPSSGPHCRCKAGYSTNSARGVCELDTDMTENPNRPGDENGSRNEIGSSDPDIPPEDFNSNGVQCNTKTSCHPNAQCVYMAHVNQYLCQCNAGFEGDGAQCSRMEASCFRVDICHTRASCKYDNENHPICVCDPGYTGDGTMCYPITRPYDQTKPCTKRDEPATRVKEDGTIEHYFESNTSTQCGQNEYCTENTDTNTFECVCHEGFYRDGDTCISEKVDTEEPACESSCHVNAHCVSSNDIEDLIARCECDVGYTGDGIHECAPLSLGCNVVPNCHAYGECAYNASLAGYRCKCREGYVGNGFDCQPDEYRGQRPCSSDNLYCDKNANCVISPTTRKEICECNDGFHGNGVQCRAVPKNDGEFLLVNQGMAMLRVPYQPNRTDPGRPIYIQSNQMLIGISIDCKKNQVYWSNVGKNSSIKRSYYDGKNVEDVVTDNVKSPEGIAVDWVQRTLYWTDSGLHTINMANLDDKQSTVIISTDLVNPRGIAVHPYYRKIFWSDWNRNGPKIEWSNLDGTDREIFLKSKDLKLPNSLAIDFTTDEICWVDAEVRSVECMDIRTRERRKVYSNCTYPFGLTITDDRYYWSEWRTDRIESASKEGVKTQSLTLPLIGQTYLYGVVAVPRKCPQT